MLKIGQSTGATYDQALIELNAINNNALIGIAVSSIIPATNRVILRANPYFEDTLFGYEQGELIGKSVRILYASQEDFDAVARTFVPHLASTRSSCVYEANFIRKDGTVFLGRGTVSLLDPANLEKGVITLLQDATEAKRSEHKMEEERNRTQMYLDTVQTVILALDKTGRITMINRAGCKLVGYSESELAGCNWFETCLKPEVMNVIYPLFQQIMAGDLPALEYHEHTVLCRDGTTRLFAWNNSFISDSLGHKIGSISSGQDITERNQAEAALIELKDEFQVLFESSRDALILTEPPSWNFTRANRAALELFGAANETEFIALKPWDVSPEYQPDGRLSIEKAQELIQIALLKGSNFFEWEHRQLSGQVFTADVLLTVLEKKDGVFILGTVRDITQRKKNEITSMQYKTAVETTHDGFWITNNQGILLEVNKAYAEMSGYRIEELLGKHISAFEAKEQTLEEISAHVNKIMTQGWDRFETRHYHRDGHEIDLDVSVSYNPETKLIVSFLRDITERKLGENQLRASEQRYQSLFNNAEVAMFRSRLDGSETLDCNEKFLELVGRTRDEIIGKPSVILWEDPEKRQEMVRLLYKEGRVTDFEFGMKTAKGALRHCITSLKLFPESGLLEGSIRDITERKQAEIALRESEARLRVMLENEVVGIVTSKDRVIQWANPAYERLLGYEKGQLNGVSTRVIFPDEESYLTLAKNAYPVINEGKVFRTELIYLCKDGHRITVDVSGGILNPATGETLWACVDITERKKIEAKLSLIAHFDTLTGIPNRVLLADRMKQAIAQTSRDQNIMAVCYLDLDGFKPINDSLGHEAGDQMLIEVAKRIGHTIRGGDTVARLGGDEFVVLLLGLDKADECVATLERLLAAIAHPITVKNKSCTISASVGVSIYPMDDEDPDTLLRHADHAMYAAKQTGKNRFHIYDPALDRRARDQHEHLKIIRHALENNQFELHYQPKVNLCTKILVGAEALIRWRHPERGLLVPAQFLPYIENTDVDIGIGEWVTATALAQMNQWHQAGLDIEVSINISGFHMESKGFVEKLGWQLEKYPDMPKGKLQIEVLETVALNDISVVRGIIESCRKIGVGFALDDFGTGYSSLSYLSGLPIDTLKIDQSFVRDMLEDKGDMAIVQGIIALSRAFDLQTVAEGIETKEHYQTLLDMGCESGQGYFIARPMLASELINWKATFLF